MDNRPFYELDDDELLIEEAADAALSNAVTPLATQDTIPPALPLCATLRAQQASVLIQRFERLSQLTLLDHAYLVNQLACSLSHDGQDRYGFSAALRAESACILLDTTRPSTAPRSANVAFPTAGIAQLAAADLDYTARVPAGLSLRFERGELQQFTNLTAGATPFHAFRRLSLALMPTLTKAAELSDSIDQYTARARILFQSAAAKQALMPWTDLVRISEVEAEQAARALLATLQLHSKVLDT